MRVLHVIARFNVGGTATWISNLSTSLKQAGHENYLIVGEVQSGEKEDERLTEIGGMKVSSLRRRISIFQDIKTFIEVRRLIKKIDPDVINTHTAKAGVIGRLANLSLGQKRRPLVHTIHGHLLTGYFAGPIVRLFTLLEIMLSYFTDVMLFAGERVKADCFKVGIVGQKSSRVVMPGVSPINFISREHPTLTVGWLARFAKVKRPDRVIQVASKLPEIKFLLGGDGPLRNEVERNAPANCFFVGWKQPQEFWSYCDIALLTSDNEALPISLIEAQLVGLPCITTPAGSANEVVINGKNGMVSKSFDSTELVCEILRLSEDVNLRTKMGTAGKKRAESLFSLDRQLRDHLSAYSEAIAIRQKMSK